MINNNLFSRLSRTAVNTRNHRSEMKYRRYLTCMSKMRHMSTMIARYSRNKMRYMNTMITVRYMTKRKYVSTMINMINVTYMSNGNRNRDVSKCKLSSTKICMMMTNKFNFININYMTARYTMNTGAYYGNKYYTDRRALYKRTV